MIIIHTHVIKLLYFLIIKLYKVILYLYCIHKYPHTSLFTQITFFFSKFTEITLKQKVMHTINIRYTHTHII